jgi:hypothetical protein
MNPAGADGFDSSNFLAMSDGYVDEARGIVSREPGQNTVNPFFSKNGSAFGESRY